MSNYANAANLPLELIEQRPNHMVYAIGPHTTPLGGTGPYSVFTGHDLARIATVKFWRETPKPGSGLKGTSAVHVKIAVGVTPEELALVGEPRMGSIEAIIRRPVVGQPDMMLFLMQVLEAMIAGDPEIRDALVAGNIPLKETL